VSVSVSRDVDVVVNTMGRNRKKKCNNPKGKKSFEKITTNMRCEKTIFSIATKKKRKKSWKIRRIDIPPPKHLAQSAGVN